MTHFTSNEPAFQSTALILLIIAGFSAGACAAETSPVNAHQTEVFESKIRPLLVDKCYKCHSAESKKSKGGLALDTRVALLKGGETGAAIVPGDSAKSLLMQAVRYGNKDLQMPPDEQLSAAEIADLDAWIKMGAPDPREGKRELSKIEVLLEKSKTHWAFQPLPKIDASERSIDAFIEERLTKEGFKLSPPADKRTLIRRAYFDLTGLPPSFEEIKAFEADGAPDAFDKVVEKLLASPRYGERWGRHWLDVARYADTQGAIFNGDDTYPHAYSYRDYVIRAFNNDLPYDRFVLEQLAADQLVKSDDTSALEALGFLTTGRRSDRRTDENVIDDRIDVIGRGLLGMTIACARCHDHKLEPITTKDYYGLYGILMSCKEPDVFPAIVPQADTPKRREFVKENERLRKAAVNAAGVLALDSLQPLRKRVGDYLLAAHESARKKTYDDAKLQTSYLNPRKLNDGIHNTLVTNYDVWVEKHPEIFAPWIKFEKIKSGAFFAQSILLSRILAANADKSLNPRVAALFATPPISLLDVSDRYNRLFEAASTALDSYQRPRLAENKFFQALDAESSLEKLREVVMDRLRVAPEDVVKNDDDLRSLIQVLLAEKSPFNLPASQFGSFRLFSEDSKAFSNAENECKKLESTHPGAPVRAMALQESKPLDAKVFVRGNPKTLGPDAPRRFLTTFASPSDKPFPKDKSGRLEFAQGIIASPVAARVIVNRVWQWHFGEGLVRTPSDFGNRGDAPSHPELLDCVATRFVRDGWSIKKLHRLIMSSATYRQSSAAVAECVKRDPSNALLWKFPSRPLDFEPFRDSILSVCGKLNLDMGGKAVNILEANDTACRRTVYGIVDRKQPPSLYRSFDFPDANFSAPKRSRTALTPRALLLLNSPIFVDAAKALAKALQKDLPDDASRIKELYRRVFQCEGSEKEVQRAFAFLASYPANDRVQPEAQDWKYGYAEFDLSQKVVKDFTPLTNFDGKKWQSKSDPKTPVVMLTPDGGEPGTNIKSASVRRWVAPVDGKLVINAELTHHIEKSDGVIARVVSSRAGLLGEWKANYESVKTDLPNIVVKKGDTLDFIVSSGADACHDAYQWAPHLTMPGTEMPGMPEMPRRWDSRLDFADPAKPPTPLTAWEELVQVLLLSNEFAWTE